MTESDVATERPADPSSQPPRGKTSPRFASSIAVKTAGILTGAIAVAAVASAITSGRLYDLGNQDQYQDRLEAINGVYRQGVRTRQDLQRTGIALTNEAACEDAFHRTKADREAWYIGGRGKGTAVDPAFAELRRLSFINGCLGRPNELPATPLPPTPTPTASS